ncbi:MAG TPA: hypothetical protein VK501_24100 [Baekduia sp.]|uniref:hypothetical protein n=1 Tax=Baekduia sp. TaxID=2600305 RepID=UPI002BE9BAE9|nr:hypothetical protein [Baekduia sp.]HMJ37010.1 hypothetical protein [Baekduia sp.]
MQHELTIQQAREIAHLRRNHPGAELRAHQKPWGVIVEVRHHGHTVALERFDWTGAAVPDRPIQLAA